MQTHPESKSQGRNFQTPPHTHTRTHTHQKKKATSFASSACRTYKDSSHVKTYKVISHFSSTGCFSYVSGYINNISNFWPNARVNWRFGSTKTQSKSLWLYGIWDRLVGCRYYRTLKLSSNKKLQFAKSVMQISLWHMPTIPVLIISRTVRKHTLPSQTFFQNKQMMCNNSDVCNVTLCSCASGLPTFRIIVFPSLLLVKLGILVPDQRKAQKVKIVAPYLLFSKLQFFSHFQIPETGVRLFIDRDEIKISKYEAWCFPLLWLQQVILQYKCLRDILYVLKRDVSGSESHIPQRL